MAEAKGQKRAWPAEGCNARVMAGPSRIQSFRFERPSQMAVLVFTGPRLSGFRFPSGSVELQQGIWQADAGFRTPLQPIICCCSLDAHERL